MQTVMITCRNLQLKRTLILLRHMVWLAGCHVVFHVALLYFRKGKWSHLLFCLNYLSFAWGGFRGLTVRSHSELGNSGLTANVYVCYCHIDRLDIGKMSKIAWDCWYFTRLHGLCWAPLHIIVKCVGKHLATLPLHATPSDRAIACYLCRRRATCNLNKHRRPQTYLTKTKFHQSKHIWSK